MEEKIESEHSYSGDSSSSSETSSSSSDGDDEVLEPVCILGHSLELPQELCEDYSVFKEFFSMKTWDALEDKHKEELCKYLPTFPENDEEEKKNTIKMLFDHEPFLFSSPLGDFYNNLNQGNYRPDIAKMRKFLKKARTKQQKHKLKSYYAKLLPEVLISRERVLAAVKSAPPGPIPRLPLIPPKPSSKNNYKPLYLRARQRYFEELAAIRSEVGGDVSEDENYPEGPPEQLFRKRKQKADGNVSGTLGGIDQTNLSSLQCLKNALAAHRSRRQYRETHPELNTSGITLEDIKQRVNLVNGVKKFMFGGHTQKLALPIQKIKRGPKKDSQKQSKQDSKVQIKKVKDEKMDIIENKPLLQNLKIKCEREESDSESSSFVDPVASPKFTKKYDHVEIKQEDIKYPNIVSNFSYNDPAMDSMVKQESQESLVSLQNSTRINQPVPIKLEDLDGIDMMALPVELADESGEVIQVDTSAETADEALVEADDSLTEMTHANFLSLVRALFPARSAHRASKQQLHLRCAAVMKSPIAPLNTWYNLSDDWCAELNSALDFLAGERGPHPEEFVPYLQYMPETQVYQWIGAGRDGDAILSRLCERWRRSVSPPPRPSEPPPPRYRTTWSVRPPTDAEIAEFHVQERRRFACAAKPFTYKQHGYRAVVGPCGRAAVSGASTLLCAERPRHAALSVLVRDALARLPNGEGTRHHVLTLLKMSQWIAPCGEQTLLSAVTAVLDRLVSAKRDPIVKYDQRTAIWTYLHRHRSEEDWLKITNRGRGIKACAVPALRLPAAPRTPSPPGAAPLVERFTQHSPQHAMELEVGSIEEVIDNASDSDVDVDDSGVPPLVPHLSSAQLLMQATQATQAKPAKPVKQAMPTKSKSKLITQIQKPKSSVQSKVVHAKQTSSKQTVLMSQSAKQANLLAQSVRQNVNQAKQSSVMQPSKIQVAQPTKQINSTPQMAKQTGVTPQQPKQLNAAKQSIVKLSPGQMKQMIQTKPLVQSPKQSPPLGSVPGQLGQVVAKLSKSLPSVVASPQRSPLIKQRPLQKVEASQSTSQQVPTSNVTIQTYTQTQPPSLIQCTSSILTHSQSKVTPVTRSLLIRPTSVQTTAMSSGNTPASNTQATPTTRRGVVRVLSPAIPSSGKSLISPRALMQQAVPTAKKRTAIPSTGSATTIAQSTASLTTVISSLPTVVTSSVPTRTVQLAGGRTVQLAADQTVHLPGGQAVQLTSGHTLQLSSLQLPTHSVRLPSGQTVQLASTQSVQAVRVSTTTVKNPSPLTQSASTVKTIQATQSNVQIPVSTVQLAGQTVQLPSQSVQLTGHTVKLPSGQSVQVASQGAIPNQSVQMPSRQTVQLTSSNMQTVQLGSNVQSSGQCDQVSSGQAVHLGSKTVQLSGQTVQLSGQTVQLAGQTVQLPSGQTLQLPSGQTVQLTSGQTLQLASGQTVQLANQTAKTITQVVRNQAPGDKPTTTQPIVAKLLTNAQGQMISLESVGGGTRALQLSGVRARTGVRVLPAGARLSRPLLLTTAKPLHNIILQQGESGAIRATSSGAVTSSQTLVLSNIGAQAVTTSTPSAPVLKLQQVNAIQQVKLAQGIKIQQAITNATTASSSGVRSVLMDGQQLKLVSGRHVLAKILRPTHPPQ